MLSRLMPDCQDGRARFHVSGALGSLTHRRERVPLTVSRAITFSTEHPPPRYTRQDLPELHRAIRAENPPPVAE
jgi:hypothetical protein